MATNDDLVIFHLPDGTEISNDPRFRYREFEKQQQENAKRLAKEAREAADNEELPEDEDGDEFDNLSAKELKALAKERDVDISGLKKVGEVREALRAAAAADQPDNGDDDDEDPEEA